VTFGTWWALLTVLAAGGAPWAWAVLVGMVALRNGVAVLVGWRVLGDRAPLQLNYLIPLRDVVGFCLWLAGWFGNRVRWRGQEFVLARGRLVKSGG